MTEHLTLSDDSQSPPPKFWTQLLDRMLHRLIRQGRLTIIYPGGETHSYGDSAADPVTITLHDPSLPRRLCLNPELVAGEAYTDGTLTIRGDDLAGFLTVAITNVARHDPWVPQKLFNGLRRTVNGLRTLNPIGRSRANVAHHYDLSDELYRTFLDEDRQYSCAYFADPAMTLEAAQAAKKAHIAKKLLIEPGMRVLDIGCGWGGMALTLARDYGAKVTGVTLSREQLAIGKARVREAGLKDQIDLRLQDYRDITETFDRVVSVGMFEHVGTPHYRTYFRKVRECLTPDGVALIHTIGRSGPPGFTSPWINKYIFPGGYVPAMSETLSAVEKERLVTTDVEVWRLHYADTLKHWRARFEAAEDRMRALYDERFCRMWRFYLCGSEMAFRHNDQVVFQFQLARNKAAVPQTRDYLCGR